MTLFTAGYFFVDIILESCNEFLDVLVCKVFLYGILNLEIKWTQLH